MRTFLRIFVILDDQPRRRNVLQPQQGKTLLEVEQKAYIIGIQEINPNPVFSHLSLISSEYLVLTIHIFIYHLGKVRQTLCVQYALFTVCDKHVVFQHAECTLTVIDLIHPDSPDRQQAWKRQILFKAGLTQFGIAKAKTDNMFIETFS